MKELSDINTCYEVYHMGLRKILENRLLFTPINKDTEEVAHNILLEVANYFENRQICKVIDNNIYIYKDIDFLLNPEELDLFVVLPYFNNSNIDLGTYDIIKDGDKIAEIIYVKKRYAYKFDKITKELKFGWESFLTFL